MAQKQDGNSNECINIVFISLILVRCGMSLCASLVNEYCWSFEVIVIRGSMLAFVVLMQATNGT